MNRGRYDQIANYVLAQSEINIAIGEKAPEVCFAELARQCKEGKPTYGGITDLDEMRTNLRMHRLPDEMIEGDIQDYATFLEKRRKLMAARIRTYFERL